MARAYNVIDADGHVLEPVDIWDKYIDPAYRERAPRIIVDTDGKERLQVGEQVLGSQKGFGVIGAIGSRDHEVPEETMRYIDGRKGGFDPHARIPDMDLDGIDAAFLYPSVGLFSGAIKEPKLAAAVCRAYNRWLAEYCQPYPDRLFGVAMLPMQSIELAIEEMRFARKELGMRAGFLRPNPYNGRMLHHPDYEVFWSAVEDLDMAIGLHEGASGGMPQVGVDRFSGREENAEALDGVAAESVRRAVGGVEVPVRAEVAGVHLPIEAVLALKPGDVLSLQAPADGGVTLYADKVPVHRARPGRSGSRRAVQITGPAGGAR